MPAPIPPEQKIKMLYHCVKVAGRPDMDELAKVMGLSKVAVEARYNRLMKSLREEYEGPRSAPSNGTTTKTTKASVAGKGKAAATNKRQAPSEDSDSSSEDGRKKKIKSEAVAPAEEDGEGEDSEREDDGDGEEA